MVRVYDLEESLLTRYEFRDSAASPGPRDKISLRVPASGKGLYQVIAHGWPGTEIELTTCPGLDYGIFGHLRWLLGRGNQFADTYVNLPSGLHTLNVSTEDSDLFHLSDETGVSKLPLDKTHASGNVELPKGEDRIWRLSAKGREYRLDFKGPTIILCP
jgi:hypothetical protein